MRPDPLLKVLFVIYCLEAGLVFLLAPWTPAWDRWLVQASWLEIRAIGIHPVFRGAISGFGCVHLVWAAHDLHDWLTTRRLSP